MSRKYSIFINYWRKLLESLVILKRFTQLVQEETRYESVELQRTQSICKDNYTNYLAVLINDNDIM